MTNLERMKKEARENILRCKTDARSVLLSMPAQHRCDRPRCGNFWVVDTEPPVCKMFDYEKHLDFTIDHIHAETVRECIDMLPTVWPREDGIESNDFARGYNRAVQHAHKNVQALLPEPV